MTDLRQERLIEILAYQLYLSTLTGTPSPNAVDLRARMVNPRPGDLILEVTTIWREERTGTRLGEFLRKVDEPLTSVIGGDPAEWTDHGEPEPLIPVWYIRLADGSEYRWHNANFIAVPTNLPGYQQPFESNPAACFALPEKAPLNPPSSPTEPSND